MGYIKQDFTHNQKLTTAMNTLDIIISTLDSLYMAIYISIIT